MVTFAQRMAKTSLTACAWSALGLGAVLVLLAAANFPRIQPTMVGEGLLGAGLAWSLLSLARRKHDPTHPEDSYFIAILVTTVTCGSVAWLISLLR